MHCNDIQYVSPVRNKQLRLRRNRETTVYMDVGNSLLQMQQTPALTHTPIFWIKNGTPFQLQIKTALNAPFDYHLGIVSKDVLEHHTQPREVQETVVCTTQTANNKQQTTNNKQTRLESVRTGFAKWLSRMSYVS